MEFAETKKGLRAEYHLLTQPITIDKHNITVELQNPIEETLLDNIKSDLATYLREKLRNTNITIQGKLVQQDCKKMIYTNKEKLEHLVQKNPMLKELRDRLGLDPDF